MSKLRRMLMAITNTVNYIYKIPLLEYNDINSNLYYISDGNDNFIIGKTYNFYCNYEIICTSYTSGSVRNVVFDYEAFGFNALGVSLGGLGTVSGTIDINLVARSTGGLRFGLRFYSAIMTCNIKITDLAIKEVE